MSKSIALSYILGMSTRGLKLEGRTMRCKLEASTFGRQPEDTIAVRGLLMEGAAVRVLEQSTIYDASLAKDNTVVWTTTPARRDRSQVTVEVTI